MTAFDRARKLILGEVVDAPADLPPDSVPEGVVFRRGPLVPRLAGVLGGMGGPASAVTLGRTIVLDPAARLTRSLLAHELVHVEQWRKDRLFPLRYAAASLRYGYWNNPYEVEARAAQPPARSTPSVEESE